jgi:hypothetical protein
MVMYREGKFKYLLTELAHHLPYSIFGVSLGLVFMGILTFLAILLESEHLLPKASGELFHVFHPSHVLLSGVATTAMFWKHEHKLFKAIIVGFVGTITVCGISDILFPFIGGNILGANMEFHICIIEEPGLVYPFAIVGVIAGLLITKNFEKSTQYSHSAHVFVSSVASILYLLSFGVQDWIHAIGQVFIVTVFAVMIPCCASDIVFPLACSCNSKEH